MSKVISIVNQKGGVGKTTTSINLSAALGLYKKKTLLIDLDPQGNSSSSFGIDKNNLDNHIYDVLLHLADAKQAVRKTSIKHLDIIPSNIDLIGAEIELVNQISRENKLKTALADIRNDYEYILIDCPPSLGLLTINALTASDFVIIPIQCEYYGLEGVSQLLNTIRLVNKSLNPALDIMGVVLTMYDKRLKLSFQVAKDVRRHFGAKMFLTIIQRNVKLSEAPGFAKSIFHYDGTSIGARNYYQLATELLER